MARPTKQGLDSFQVEVEFDDKMALYVMEHGAVGLAVLITTCQAIYRDEGYFVINSPDLHLQMKHLLNVDKEVSARCLQTCLMRGIFDLYLHDQYGILTSSRVQQFYFETAKRKKAVNVYRQFLLVETNGYKNLTLIERNEVNVVRDPVTLKVSGKAVEATPEETPGKKPKATLAEKPPDVDDQVWQDFQVLRKAKKSPFTVTALRDTISAAEKAGLSLEEALKMCCRRGWQGFEARYFRKEEATYI